MTSCSRPNSYISLESDSERCQDSECDVSVASGSERAAFSGGKEGGGGDSLEASGQKETTPTNEGILEEAGEKNGNNRDDVEGVMEDNINNNSGGELRDLVEGGDSLTLMGTEGTEDSTC